MRLTTRVTTNEILRLGQRVTFARADAPSDGIAVTVSLLHRDPTKSIASGLSAVAHVRPGGFVVTWDDTDLAAGRVIIHDNRA